MVRAAGSRLSGHALAGRRVYISGPISGRSLAVARDEFAKAEGTIKAMGARTYNPARALSMYSTRTHNEYMRHCLHVLTSGDIGRRESDYDAVVLLPGWQESDGARMEAEVARAIGLDVMELSDIERAAPLGQRYGIQ